MLLVSTQPISEVGFLFKHLKNLQNDNDGCWQVCHRNKCLCAWFVLKNSMWGVRMFQPIKLSSNLQECIFEKTKMRCCQFFLHCWFSRGLLMLTVKLCNTPLATWWNVFQKIMQLLSDNASQRRNSLRRSFFENCVLEGGFQVPESDTHFEMSHSAKGNGVPCT